MSENEPQTTASEPRTMDLESLKALAHPLRVKIVDTLSMYGEFTASGLAERLGESSGATSYHLRQLEKHNFVREVEGKGTARERWWERVPGAIALQGPVIRETPTGKAASALVLNEWTNGRERVVRDFVERGDEVLSHEWMEATTISTSNLFLTIEQLQGITDELQAVVDRSVEKYRGQRVPGSRPVQVQVATIPIVDGTEITAEDAS